MGNAAISIEQYAIYKEAKKLIREEFNHTISLADDWLMELKVFTILAKSERLGHLYESAMAA